MTTTIGRLRGDTMALTVRQSLTTLLGRRDVLVALSAIALAVITWHVYRKLPEADLFGFDSFAYWSVDPAGPYGRTVGETKAFLYAPPLAQLFAVGSALPWPAFRILWLLVELAALAWLAREWTLVVLAFPPVFSELYFGNVNLLYAVAIVVGFRWAGTWAFILLTKVTPGIGLLWFAVRREWRSLAVALGVTAAIVTVSWLLVPGLWRDWVTVLIASDSMASPTAVQIPLLPRLIAAAALIAWGGTTNRRWTVPIGVVLALPVIWVAGLSILVALVPLARADLARATSAEPLPDDRTLVAST